MTDAETPNQLKSGTRLHLLEKLIAIFVSLSVAMVESFAQLTFGVARGVQAWFVLGLLGGAFGWMIYALAASQNNSILGDIQFFETIYWSRHGLWAGLIIMFAGLLAAIWTGDWVVWLAGGLLASITMGVLAGVRSSNEVAAISHDQSIWHSLFVALGVGMISGIPWIIAGLTMSLFVEEGFIGGLASGVFFMSFGLAIGLSKGGSAIVNHYALRLVLWRSGAIPWAYVRLLDFAAQRILLRKVGGGYIFIHRLLLDYFAAQYTGPETAEVKTTSKDR